MAKTWLITGASKGLGRAFAEAAAARGDRVAATARDVSALDGFAERTPGGIALPLDVTDEASVRRAVAEAERQFGHLDIVVNNAGYGHFGAVEEITDAELNAQLETNVLGPLRVMRAVLPRMRERGNGHLIQVSSLGGIGAFANLGAYHASKWALEGLSESLAAEVRRFGIRVTLVEPGGYDTDWGGRSARRSTPITVYDVMRDEAAARRSSQAPGDPRAAAEALREVVEADEPPLRVLFGAGVLDAVNGIYERRIDQWARWASVSARAQGALL